jgi:hypothetical protein
MFDLNNRVALMRRASAILLLSTAALWIGLVDFRGGTSTSAAVSSLRALTAMIPVRPTIYTFSELKVKDDDPQFRLWKAAWEGAGFEARALSLEDAIQHADFETYSNAIGDILPFGHRDIKMRFLRYLAMNAVGGGFLTESNVFPLWPFSYMKNGVQAREFTVRCGSIKKPTGCLLSGSAQEWNRISVELLGSVQRQYKQLYDSKGKDDSLKEELSSTFDLGSMGNLPLWSDDVALQELVSFANPSGRPIAKRESQVLSAVQASDMKSTLANFLTSQCHEAVDRLAVQFDDIEYAMEWLQQWNKGCVNKLAQGDLSLPKQA